MQKNSLNLQENSQISQENLQISQKNSTKIIFMGTPSFAARILQELIDESKNSQNLQADKSQAKFDMVGVFTGEDKAFGRGGELKQSEVKALTTAKLHQTPIFTPKTLKDEGVIKQIQGLQPDFIVVAAYGKILPKAVLDAAPCINLHASLLPKHRGASPIQHAILCGDEISGVCAMLMNERLDGGAVLASESLNIKDKRANEVFEQMGELAARLCVRVLREFHTLKPTPQDDGAASYCAKIKKSDGLVDLRDAREIYRKFLAFYPWPGVFLASGLKFIDIEFVENAGFGGKNSRVAAQNLANLKANSQAGRILAVENSHFLLGCECGVLKIKALQESGKKVVSAKDYINGKRLKVGDSLC